MENKVEPVGEKAAARLLRTSSKADFLLTLQLPQP